MAIYIYLCCFPFGKYYILLFSQLSFRTKSGLCYAFLLHFLFLLKAQIIQMISTLSEWSFSRIILLIYLMCESSLNTEK